MKLKLIALLIFSTAFYANAQHKLTINIDGLEHDKGYVIVALLDSNAKEISYKKEKITDGKCTVIFDDLKSGTYGFKYCHDENSDNIFNTNFIGMPKEGFGFSNNAKVKMKEPPFSATTFKIEGDVIQNCTAFYI